MANKTPKQRNPFTERMKVFCREYVIDHNGTQAAIRAGYSKKTAQEIASETLSKPIVKQYIRELEDEALKKHEITRDRVLKELAMIAFSNIANIASVEDTTVVHKGEKLTGRTVVIKTTDELTQEMQRSISEVKATPDGITVKLHDKVSALEKLMRHLGLFEKDNDQLNKTAIIKVGFANMKDTE